MNEDKAQKKDLRMCIVSLETKQCFREHNFPDGDPRQACHLGLKELDLRICGHCVWLNTTPGSIQKLATLTGNEIMEQMALLDAMRERNNAAAVK